MNTQSNVHAQAQAETAYNAIMAATSALEAIQIARDTSEPLPSDIDNGFIIGGLLDAIKLASDVLIRGVA